MSEVARAIQVIQQTTGCGVMLIPVIERSSTSKPTPEARLKAQEGISAPVKVTGAAPAKPLRRALKCDSEIAEATNKRVRKATKPDKEKADTFMTVAKFAELKGCHFTTVHEAIRDGRIPVEMVNKTSGATLINTRCEWEPNHGHSSVKVFCKETKMTFDSIAQAVKGTGASYYHIMQSLKNGRVTPKGMTFSRV